MELIDFAEQQGLANYQWQAKVNETTRQESNATLGFLLAGGSAAIAWAATNLTGKSPSCEIAYAAISTALWLFFLAGAVQMKCLRFVSVACPANQPLNVYRPEFDTLGIREVNLHYIEEAIIKAIDSGQEKAKSLQRLRMAACFTPLVFLASWLGAYCFR